MKITKRVKTGCALVLAASLALPGLSMVRTQAAGGIELDADCSITVSVAVGEYNSTQNKKYVEDFENMEIPVVIYKVADVDVTGQKFTPVEPFSSMKLDGIGNETKASQWLELAKEVAGNERLGEAEQWKENTVSGMAKFESLKPGMYLVAPEASYNRDYTTQYTFSPYLTALPSSAYTITYDNEGNPAHMDADGNTLGDEWDYDATIGLKSQAIPQYGRLDITKELQNFNETLGTTTFVFQVEGTDEDGNIFSEVVSTTHERLASETVTIEKIPAGMTVTVREVYQGASYEIVGDIEKDVKIWSDAAVNAADGQSVDGEVIHTAALIFENRYNGGNRGGYGVMNEFTQGADGWQWQSYPQVPDNQDTPAED